MGIETYPICERSVRRSVAPLQRDEIPVLTCGRGIVYLRNHDLITRTKKRKLLLSGRDSVLLCEEKPYAAIPDMVLILVQDLSGIA